MTIEINEQGSEAFYRETVSAAAQYGMILKNHRYVLKDYFKQFKGLLIACIALAVLMAAMAFAWGLDTILIIGLAVDAVSLVLCAAYLSRLRQTVKNMLAHPHRSVLTLDGEGVELKADTGSVKIAKNNVAVIRVFTESLCFIPAAGAGVIISVDRKYADEILGWVRENWPGTDAA